MRPLILLRPEPGLSASAARARALGLEVIRHPLFRIEPITAVLPNGPFDALVVTSANAVRSARALLDKVGGLPTYAVGAATAEALSDAGIRPLSVGEGGVAGLDLPPGRLLHLCGEVHKALPGEVVAVPVYRSVPVEGGLPQLSGTVVAVHSPVAGARLDALAGTERAGAMVAAISLAAAAACGDGWSRVEGAPAADDESLLALAFALCQSPAQ